ncbi:MAG: LytTR family DNA-binding domain-containing protein [Muribaculaceae bacterium]|nr:LytTR family DNA-binding domain-containing protein [Muribaculaceae bacterium]
MIRCVAIDDEPIALSIIEEYCRRHGGVDLECFTSPAEGMERVEALRPDVLFLDIEMNSHNGLELARTLPPGVSLVFTTAFSKYALDGFEADAVDFLHKPFFYPRFVRALEKAAAWAESRREPKVPARTGAITLKVEHKNAVISFDEILYVEAMDNYVKVYRRQLPMVMSQITMKEMEEMLPSEGFIRVHRSFIVALASIDRFSNRKIYCRDVARQIPVGRKYAESFSNMYKTLKHIDQ